MPYILHTVMHHLPTYGATVCHMVGQREPPNGSAVLSTMQFQSIRAQLNHKCDPKIH